jgi:MarR family 2-MHQ and catechol resistance regulon transcriptional repressor
MQRSSAARQQAHDQGLRRDATALHAALAALVRIYQYRDRDRICCHDVSVTQCHALEVLVDQGPQRSQALARALRLDKSTTTRVVDALVRKGYVERRADPDDARAVELRATRAGRALHDRIHGDLIELQEALIRDLAPEVRSGAIELVWRLARDAETRFAGAPSCDRPRG